MITRKEIQQIINREIEKLEFSKYPVQLYAPITYMLLLGGKRIRPVLTILAHQMYSNQINDVLPAALALELFHNFTLIHDDIMDNSDIRRSKPTVHKKWNRNIAILSGDVMNILAYKLLSNINPMVLPKVIHVFNESAIKVCEGQQLDMDFENNLIVAENDYLYMIELKTAVLLAACLKIGAIIGGAPDNHAELLYQFGINLGIAFQLQDDWLDTFGNELLLGKQIGKDIVANKKTFLLIKALELANLQQKENLLYWQNTHDNPSEKIKEIKRIFLNLEIDKITIEKIQIYVSQARHQLDLIQINQTLKEELYRLTDELSQRSF